MSQIIFYYSGTGNSYAISRAIAEKAGIKNLASILDIDNFEIGKYQTIGFVMPVHYIHIPEMVMEILKKLQLDNQKVFIIVTYAASWGYALSELRDIFLSKGVFVWEFKVKMPGNYLLEYGAFPGFYQNYILRNAEKSIDDIVNVLKNNGQTKQIKPNMLARLFWKNAEKKRKEFGELGCHFYTLDHCRNCGQCVMICPAMNIDKNENGIVWGSNCQQCMACIQWCPHNAIMHLNRVKKRKRYTHPDVSIEELRRR